MPHQTITLKDITSQFGGTLGGEDITIQNAATIQSAKEGDIAFVDNPKYQGYLQSTKASAVIVPEALANLTDKPKIISDNPKLIFAKVVAFLYPSMQREVGIHPSAVIDDTAKIGQNVSIGAHCVVEKGAQIDDGVVMEPHCVVGPYAHIGAKTHLHAKVTVYSDIIIGERCNIHSGTVIGSDGFGFANEKGTWVKLPQIGRVIIGNDVEIGANTTIDRGALDDTVIEDGCILDNLIQIGHNVKIGKCTAIAANCGIAGSCTIGAYCMIGGASIFNGHISICDQCFFIPGSQVANSIKKPGVYSSGIPARPREQWARNVARFSKLDELAQKVQKINKTVKQLAKDVEESNL